MASKIQLLQKQILELTEVIKKNGKATEEQAKQLEKLNKQYSDAISKGLLKQYKKGHEEVNKALKDSKKFTDAASKSSKSFSQRLITATGTLLRYGLAYKAINLASRVFSELTTGAISQAIEFQKSLGNLSAVAGVSGDELLKLAENAEFVAGQTKFTAEEVVGLQTELSKLGFSSQEVIDATQGIAFASQALGSPLNTTAEGIGKVINQFDLLKVESGKVADILVTTINESALSFDSFGTAIQYVGPIAKQLNLNLEQTAGAMAVLADNGFTASRIGTGLRGILTEIGKTSVDATVELQRLAQENISLSEAVDLVGKRNAAQLITLLDNIEAIDDSTDKYYQQGRAAEAAAKQSNTFAGQVQLLTSAWNAFRRDLASFVAESDLVIRAIGFISKSAEETARGFEVISEFKGGEFANDLNKAAESGNAFSVGITRMSQQLGISEERLRTMVESSRELEGMDIRGTFFGDAGPDFIFGRDNVRRTEGYIKLLQEATEETQKQNAANEGRNIANKVYGEDVERLIRLNNANLDVSKDIDTLYNDIKRAIDNRTNSLKNLNETEVLQRIEIESEITALKQLQKTLVNISSDEDDIAKKRKQEAEDIKDRYSQLRDTVFNQKSAREFNQIIDQAYAGIPNRIKLANEELKSLTEGTEEYVKKAEEIDYLEGLAKTIKGFRLSEKDIENIVKKLYDHILVSAKRENLEGLTEILNNAFKKELSRLTTGEDGTITTEPINVDIPFQPIFKPESEKETFTELDRFSLEVLKSFQTLVYQLENEGAALAQEFYQGLIETRYDNLERELDAELDLIESRYETENEILKSQLDNQLITESQFRQKQKELRKAQLAEENAIEKQRFNEEKKQDLNIAASEYLAAIAQSLINEMRSGVAFPQALINAAIMSAGAGVAYAGQVSAINKRKFFPKKFEEGGIVNGPSHANGGVPFTVQGRGGYEMEGGEFIINKEATARNYDLLQKINNSTKTIPTVGKVKFAQGGLVSAQSSESVDYLKAIAEATTSTAIGVSKPVRAYVSDKDLRSNATERRIRDRNDRL